MYSLKWSLKVFFKTVIIQLAENTLTESRAERENLSLKKRIFLVVL